jgi:hypothetical protein
MPDKVSRRDVYIVERELTGNQDVTIVADASSGDVICKEYHTKVPIKDLLFGDNIEETATAKESIITVAYFGVEKVPQSRNRVIHIDVVEDGETVNLFRFWNGGSAHIGEIDSEGREIPDTRPVPKRGGKAGYAKLMLTGLKKKLEGLSVSEAGIVMKLVPNIEMGTGRLVKKVRNGRTWKKEVITLADIEELTGLKSRAISEYMHKLKEDGIIEFRDHAWWFSEGWLKRG